jgi:hypothetical protein
MTAVTVMTEIICTNNNNINNNNSNSNNNTTNYVNYKIPVVNKISRRETPSWYISKMRHSCSGSKLRRQLPSFNPLTPELIPSPNTACRDFFYWGF